MTTPHSTTGLGTGPVVLHGDATLHLEHVDGNNRLILNGGTIDAGALVQRFSGSSTLDYNSLRWSGEFRPPPPLRQGLSTAKSM